MSEIAQGSLAALALLLTVVSAWIQMLGGRPNGRIYYRLIFPLFFSLSVVAISAISGFNPLTLSLIPYYLLVSHLGHHSFPKRILECILYGLPSIIFGFTMLFTIQLIVCILAACIGHFCKDKKAPIVELIVNFLRISLVSVSCV